MASDRGGWAVMALLRCWRSPGGLISLLFTARPRDFDDIPYRAISAPIINALHNSQLPIHIDLVRPGTYEQLHEQLETTHDKHGPGYYHIIHFDVHGKLLIKDLNSSTAFFAPHGGRQNS